jgi:hypothetical protein
MTLRNKAYLILEWLVGPVKKKQLSCIKSKVMNRRQFQNFLVTKISSSLALVRVH